MADEVNISLDIAHSDGVDGDKNPSLCALLKTA